MIIQKQSIHSHMPCFCITDFLLKIFYSGFKNLKILLSININRNRITPSFRVSHFFRALDRPDL